MRAPVEVMGENRLDGRTTPLSLDGQSSPILTPSPHHSPNNPERRAMGRAQLTIQELQDLAERQRKQILYSSKELMDKQQQLMRMHNDFRTRLKIQNGADAVPKSPRPATERPATERPVIERPAVVETTPPSPVATHPTKVPSKRDQDQYARMLRQTYHNMGKLQNRGLLQKELDIKKLNNVELAHELKKVRAIFSSKQNELAEAVKKVDVLTHELEKRKHGDSGSSSLPTPERINRRKKIQAAKDELDRLRNELIVRNEMNTQQSQQLQLQRDIIHEKQQELRELNSRINELGSALLKQHAAASGRSPPNYPAMNGYQQRFFNGSYLYDTLNRKRIAMGAGNKPAVQDINYNNVVNDHKNNVEVAAISDNSTILNGVNRIPANVAPIIDTSSNKNHQSAFADTPLSGNQIWNPEKNQNLQIRADMPTKSSPLNSPTSSVSSLSSASSTTTADDYNKIIAALNNKVPPPPPPRTITQSGPSDTSDSSLPYDNQILTILQPPAPTGEKPKMVAKNVKPYCDSTLSNDSDKLSWKYEQYGDAANSSSDDILESEEQKKMVPPPIKPKPNLTNGIPQFEVQPAQVTNNEIDTLIPLADDHSMSLSNEKDLSANVTEMDEYRYSDIEHTQNNKLWPISPMENNGPSEPEEFELSFADIDEINEIQTDLWSNSDSTMSNNDSMEDSDFEDISKAIVPVVISVSPDKMPPPILMKPEKPRKEKRNVVLDPFILLLDAALEGEMDTVKSILRKVPDPSRPNPEGITALHNAVCGNHKDVVRYLVEVACDINSADNNGWTPLHCAAFYNDTELCEYLVQHGASVFATTYTDYQTPAHKCSRLDENYDICFAYLHECKENVGRLNNGLVHALYDYTNEHEDELPFTCGEELTVLRRGDTMEKEWWWARNRNGEMGYIPCNLIGNFPRIAAVV